MAARKITKLVSVTLSNGGFFDETAKFRAEAWEGDIMVSAAEALHESPAKRAVREEISTMGFAKPFPRWTSESK